MSNFASQLEFVSVEEYLAMDGGLVDGRLEFAAGRVFALAGGTRRHALLIGNLSRALHAALEEENCHIYTSELRLRVGQTFYFYPDVMVACGDRDQDDVNESEPLIVAEVLSESTSERDFGVKLAAYHMMPSMRAYLIVAQNERRVEVHWREDEDARLASPRDGGGNVVAIATAGGNGDRSRHDLRGYGRAFCS